MSPEAQRIAIAKSVGIHLHDGDHAPSNYTFISDLPDYLNDLNAIHNVEKKLKGMQWLNYVDALLDACGCETPTITATAAQRSEAYLRTIGKWKGGSDVR